MADEGDALPLLLGLVLLDGTGRTEALWASVSTRMGSTCACGGSSLKSLSALQG